MKKYECKKCSGPCILKVDDDAYFPQWCPYKQEKVNWHEVKEETTTNSSQLPDWVKECAIGYDNEQERYFEVTNVSENGVDIEFPIGICATLSYSDMLECSEARKRPFNTQELKHMVGQLVTNLRGDISIVSDYDSGLDSVYIVDTWFSGKELLQSSWEYVNNPCYVLEHLNEKGEWVE